MDELVTLFKALTDETRFRIINLLLKREFCVCELVEILDMSQPRLSRHLNILKQTGILQSWREGKWMHYAIKKELSNYCKTVLNGVGEKLSQDKTGKLDLQKAKKVSRKPGKSCCEI
ncbi:MAG: metalloregulator ArsR/SmtB family transcription factor [bacterium]|nr:metalloregulator ArsR/SmtB family transcription factor [bacterium]